MAEVRYYGGEFVVKIEIWDNMRVKNAPNRKWNPDRKVWHIPANRANALYIKSVFDSTELTEGATHALTQNLQRPISEPFPEQFDFGKYPPMDHQGKALNEAWGKDAYAFFFEMRLGKTYTAIKLAEARFQEGQIDQMLVICPTPIKDVWAGEFNKFLDTEHQVQVFESGMVLRPWTPGVLRILVVGVEALSVGPKKAEKGKKAPPILQRIRKGRPKSAPNVALSFVKSGETMGVVDESSRIKNYKSMRTEVAVGLASACAYRAILTGTPTTQGLHDLYTQFEFLDPQIIGQKSYFTFRNRYCVMGGFEGRQILGYKNAKQLMDLIEPYSMVVKTKDVYDLVDSPPQPRIIQPTAEQKQHFAELKAIMATTFEGETLEVKTILERLTRFQQINGGFFPYPDGTDKKGKTIWNTKPLRKNPKLLELEEMLDEIGEQQTIIWARFVPEIEQIVGMLAKHGKTFGTFFGGTPEDQREINKKAFQAGDIQFIVGNQGVGGMGQKFSAADVMIYFSNTFSYEDRKQSLARWQDMERTTGCAVYDLVLNTAIDKSIMAAQEKKGGMAKYVDENIKAIKAEIS